MLSNLLWSWLPPASNTCDHLEYHQTDCFASLLHRGHYVPLGCWI